MLAAGTVKQALSSVFLALKPAVLIAGGIRILIILLIGWLANKLSHRVLRSVLRKRNTQHSRTLEQVLSSGIKYLIYFFVFCAVLDVFGISVTSVLAVAGIGSVAIGFGAQTLVKDIITGVFILVEEQYGVGDVVEIGDKTGVVETIALRTTSLRSSGNNELYIIPHSTITVVTNKSKDFQRGVVEVEIPFEHDLDDTLKVLTNAMAVFEDDDRMLSLPNVQGVSKFTENGMLIKITCDCKLGNAYNVEQDIRRRVVYALEENNIEIPYATRTVHLQQAK